MRLKRPLGHEKSLKKDSHVDDSSIKGEVGTIDNIEIFPEDQNKENFDDIEYKVMKSKEERRIVSERMFEFLEQIKENDIDSLIFLDRSARPLSWLFIEMWKRRFKDLDMPTVRYANIGRASGYTDGDSRLTPALRSDAVVVESLKNYVNEFASHTFIDIDMVPEQFIEHVSSEKKPLQQLRENYKNQFSGQRILIIDEFSDTGGTLMTAQALFDSAFPDAAGVQATAFLTREQVHSRQMSWSTSTTRYVPVLELFDNEKLLTAKISEKNVKLIQKEVEKRTREVIEVNLSVDVAEYSSNIKLVKQKLKDRLDGEDDKEVIVQILKLFTDLEGTISNLGEMAMHIQFMPIGSMSSRDLERVITGFEVFLEKENLLYKQIKSLEELEEYSKLLDLVPELQELRVNILSRNEMLTSFGHIANAYNVYKNSRKLSDIKQLLEESKQLRMEMKKLAEEYFNAF